MTHAMTLRWVVAAALLAILFVGVIVALHPLFKRYRVPSESMEPTIRLGDEVNLNRGETPAIGDIVIFHPPTGAESAQCGSRPAGGQPCAQPTADESDVLFIKRIVAGPRDQVAFKSGRTVRNGSPVNEPFVDDCGDEACDLPRPATVPDGMYFMVGDNRDASDDSRFWGPVPGDWIVGRVERCHALYFACSPAR
jgi:signal peptidase I